VSDSIGAFGNEIIDLLSEIKIEI